MYFTTLLREEAAWKEGQTFKCLKLCVNMHQR